MGVTAPSFASISAFVGMLGADGEVTAGADDDAPADDDELAVARGRVPCAVHPASAKLETSKNPRRLHLTGPACQVPAIDPANRAGRRHGPSTTAVWNGRVGLKTSDDGIRP